jgi:hypothetical protein
MPAPGQLHQQRSASAAEPDTRHPAIRARNIKCSHPRVLPS